MATEQELAQRVRESLDNAAMELVKLATMMLDQCLSFMQQATDEQKAEFREMLLNPAKMRARVAKRASSPRNASGWLTPPCSRLKRSPGFEVHMSKSKRQPDLFLEEARRLAQLPARDRKEALAVHQRIADDVRLSDVTRDYARYVAETLERLIEKLLKKR